MSLRVRIAPSPTGPAHLGTAYQALFDKVFALRFGGRFVLRIEDTDQARSRREYEEQLMRSLRWLGLDWDEGPEVGGPHGPYRQSERLEIYREHAQKLVEAGHAYPCFCTPARLGELRAAQRRQKQQLGYDGRCRHLSAREMKQKLDQGLPHVVRMKIPREGACGVQDALRGRIEFDYGRLDDQVLLKSDGFPTYHLAVVVDDHLMEITHVIRGEEWIPSTPKHLLLYEYFGWEPPAYLHLPLLLNADGSKMSKRRNPTSIEYYRRAGYLPQALLNYLALMAYPPAGGEEKFTLEELVERFEPGRINLGGSVFDPQKLNWLNGRYIREELQPGELLEAVKAWRFNDEALGRMLPLVQERMETLGDFMDRCAFFFVSRVEPRPEDLVPGRRDPAEAAQMLQTAVWALEGLLPWDGEGVEAALRRVAAFWEWPIREVTGPLFAALMGQRVGPPLFESAALLGADLVRARILEAVQVLGGLSKKKTAKLEKAWKAGAAGDPGA